MGASDRKWWKEAVVYQVYPSTFADSSGSGVGDLKGVTSHLDHLKALGVDVVWLSPFFASPQVDMGYDISDYRAIDPTYGTMADFDEMLAGIHARGMKMITDLVVNHTSDQHAWFKESRSSKTNPKRDWYIWKAGTIDEKGKRCPPNNWISVFREGSAWEYDSTTDEYYLHLYCVEQPDLNWDCKAVREAVYEMMRWWLDKGVNGFRMDVINLISKVPGYPDAEITEPESKLQPAFSQVANGPRVHEYIKEMNREVLSKYDIMTMGETPFSYDSTILLPYVLPEANELQMLIHFELPKLDGTPGNSLIKRDWKLTSLKKIIEKWAHAMEATGAGNSNYFANHDQPTAITRFGNDSPEYREISGKMVAMFQCTLTGTVTIYNGQEFGQINVPKSWGQEEYKDTMSRGYYDRALAERIAAGDAKPDMSDIMHDIQGKARDNARTPMQWDSSKNAGFTTGDTPWMRVHDDYAEWNVKSQREKPNSLMNFYTRLFQLRKEYLALTYGNFVSVQPSNEKVFAYLKLLADSPRLLVLLNFTSEAVPYELKEVDGILHAKLVLGNHDGVATGLSSSSIELQPYETRLYSLA